MNAIGGTAISSALTLVLVALGGCGVDNHVELEGVTEVRRPFSLWTSSRTFGRLATADELWIGWNPKPGLRYSPEWGSAVVARSKACRELSGQIAARTSGDRVWIVRIPDDRVVAAVDFGTFEFYPEWGTKPAWATTEAGQVVEDSRGRGD